MAYAREENLPVEATEECERLALHSQYSLEQLVEAARYIYGCGETLATLQKVVALCQQHGGNPIAIANMLNELAFEAGRAE